MTKIGLGDILQVTREGETEPETCIVINLGSGSFSARPLLPSERARRQFVENLEQLTEAAREGKLRDWQVRRSWERGSDPTTTITFAGAVNWLDGPA